jgi:hypothetical protein
MTSKRERVSPADPVHAALTFEDKESPGRAHVAGVEAGEKRRDELPDVGVPRMLAAVTSRTKVSVSILSVVVMLLAGGFARDWLVNRDPGIRRDADTAATSDSVTMPVIPTADEASRRLDSTPPSEVRDPPAGAQVPAGGSSDPESLVEGTLHALPVETPIAASGPDVSRKVQRGTVAAECWGLRGSAPRDFVVSLDRDVRTSGDASALISSQRKTDGYVTMFQTAGAAPVRGKRVEFSADVRTRGVIGGANLLLRAEDANGNTVAFDNMQTSYGADRRPDRLVDLGVKGDTEWSTQRVVVDIPDEARVITYGVSVFRGGNAWIDNARIEVVSDDIETTAIDIRSSPQPVNNIPINPASLTRNPRNLDFDREAQAGGLPCN